MSSPVSGAARLSQPLGLQGQRGTGCCLVCVGVVRGVLPVPSMTSAVTLKRVMPAMMVLLAESQSAQAAAAGAQQPQPLAGAGGLAPPNMPAAAMFGPQPTFTGQHHPSVVPVVVANALMEVVTRFREDSKLVEQVGRLCHCIVPILLCRWVRKHDFCGGVGRSAEDL